jgi:hypothetical protein
MFRRPISRLKPLIACAFALGLPAPGSAQDAVADFY